MAIKVPISITLQAVRGIFRQAAPDVFREALIKMLNLTNVDRAKAWVKDDISLWKQLPKGIRLHILKAVCMLLAKDINWLTFDWIVSAIRDNHPELASYLSNNKEASDWLERQINNIRWMIYRYPCPLEKGRPKTKPSTALKNP